MERLANVCVECLDRLHEKHKAAETLCNVADAKGLPTLALRVQALYWAGLELEAIAKHAGGSLYETAKVLWTIDDYRESMPPGEHVRRKELNKYARQDAC